MKGQCYCGAVQYEVEPPLMFVAHDHCSICRRLSGAAFVTWAGVHDLQFRIHQGVESLTRFKSTPEAERQFCAKCGSHLFFRSSRWPGQVHFTVATLIDPLPIPPQEHVYYSDRVDWIRISDDLPKRGGASGNDPVSS